MEEDKESFKGITYNKLIVVIVQIKNAEKECRMQDKVHRFMERRLEQFFLYHA